MPSFRILVSPSRRAAARFITQVRRAFQRAYVEEKQKRGLSQSAIAREIGVHRSVINRELVGRKDITVGRIGELAWAMGRIPFFALPESPAQLGMIPIKQVSVDISRSGPMVGAGTNQAIIDEWKKQAHQAQTPTDAYLRLMAA
jgi:hypothetical protein